MYITVFGSKLLAVGMLLIDALKTVQLEKKYMEQVLPDVKLGDFSCRQSTVNFNVSSITYTHIRTHTR